MRKGMVFAIVLAVYVTVGILCLVRLYLQAGW